MLWERNFNAAIAEGPPDRLIHLAADAHVVHRVGDPEAQAVINSGVAVVQQ